MDYEVKSSIIHHHYHHAVCISGDATPGVWFHHVSYSVLIMQLMVFERKSSKVDNALESHGDGRCLQSFWRCSGCQIVENVYMAACGDGKAGWPDGTLISSLSRARTGHGK